MAVSDPPCSRHRHSCHTGVPHNQRHDLCSLFQVWKQRADDGERSTLPGRCRVDGLASAVPGTRNFMNFSSLFIQRPVATLLLSLGLHAAGIVSYQFLPVAALPNVDVPAVVVFAARPGGRSRRRWRTRSRHRSSGASARLAACRTCSRPVPRATPTSSSCSTSTAARMTAAREVQSAINAAQTDLPSGLPVRPTYKKFNPADPAIITLALSSDHLSVGQVYEAADTVLQQRFSQVEGVSRVQIDGGQTPAIRVQLDPGRIARRGHLGGGRASGHRDHANVLEPTGSFQGPPTSRGDHHQRPDRPCGGLRAGGFEDQGTAPCCACRTWRTCHRQRQQPAPRGLERPHSRRSCCGSTRYQAPTSSTRWIACSRAAAADADAGSRPTSRSRYWTTARKPSVRARTT